MSTSRNDQEVNIALENAVAELLKEINEETQAYKTNNVDSVEKRQKWNALYYRAEELNKLTSKKTTVTEEMIKKVSTEAVSDITKHSLTDIDTLQTSIELYEKSLKTWLKNQTNIKVSEISPTLDSITQSVEQALGKLKNKIKEFSNDYLAQRKDATEHRKKLNSARKTIEEVLKPKLDTPLSRNDIDELARDLKNTNFREYLSESNEFLSAKKAELFPTPEQQTQSAILKKLRHFLFGDKTKPTQSTPDSSSAGKDIGTIDSPSTSTASTNIAPESKLTQDKGKEKETDLNTDSNNSPSVEEENAKIQKLRAFLSQCIKNDLKILRIFNEELKKQTPIPAENYLEKAGIEKAIEGIDVFIRRFEQLNEKINKPNVTLQDQKHHYEIYRLLKIEKVNSIKNLLATYLSHKVLSEENATKHIATESNLTKQIQPPNQIPSDAPTDAREFLDKEIGMRSSTEYKKNDKEVIQGEGADSDDLVSTSTSSADDDVLSDTNPASQVKPTSTSRSAWFRGSIQEFTNRIRGDRSNDPAAQNETELEQFSSNLDETQKTQDPSILNQHEALESSKRSYTVTSSNEHRLPTSENTKENTNMKSNRPSNTAKSDNSTAKRSSARTQTPSTPAAGPTTQATGPTPQPASATTQASSPTPQPAGATTQASSPTPQPAGATTQASSPTPQPAGATTQATSQDDPVLTQDTDARRPKPQIQPEVHADLTEFSEEFTKLKQKVSAPLNVNPANPNTESEQRLTQATNERKVAEKSFTDTLNAADNILEDDSTPPDEKENAIEKTRKKLAKYKKAVVAERYAEKAFLESIQNDVAPSEKLEIIGRLSELETLRQEELENLSSRVLTTNEVENLNKTLHKRLFIRLQKLISHMEVKAAQMPYSNAFSERDITTFLADWERHAADLRAYLQDLTANQGNYKEIEGGFERRKKEIRDLINRINNLATSLKNDRLKTDRKDKVVYFGAHAELVEISPSITDPAEYKEALDKAINEKVEVLAGQARIYNPSKTPYIASGKPTSDKITDPLIKTTDVIKEKQKQASVRVLEYGKDNKAKAMAITRDDGSFHRSELCLPGNYKKGLISSLFGDGMPSEALCFIADQYVKGLIASKPEERKDEKDIYISRGFDKEVEMAIFLAIEANGFTPDTSSLNTDYISLKNRNNIKKFMERRDAYEDKKLRHLHKEIASDMPIEKFRKQIKEGNGPFAHEIAKTIGLSITNEKEAAFKADKLQGIETGKVPNRYKR